MKLWRRLFAAVLLAALLCACSAPGETGGSTEGSVSGSQSSAEAAALQTDEPEILPTPTPKQFGLTGAYAALFEAILDQTGSSWSLTLPSIAVRGSRTYPGARPISVPSRRGITTSGGRKSWTRERAAFGLW